MQDGGIKSGGRALVRDNSVLPSRAGRSAKASRAMAGALVALGLGLGACAQDPVLVAREPDAGAARFDARALVGIIDADMAATAYADGRLHPQEGTRDQLIVLQTVEEGAGIASASASNSVMGWPGAVDVSPDGRFAYVVETKAAAPVGVSAFENLNAGMPNGQLLTAVDLTDPGAPRAAASLAVGASPTSVHVAPDGRFALVSLKDPAAPLAAVLLEEELPVAVRPLALPVTIPPARVGDEGALFVRLSPDGRRFVMNIGNQHLLLGRLVFDEAGLPVGAEATAAPVRVGRWLSMLRWSRDGRHVIAADVGWGPTNLGAVFNRAGSLIALRAEETDLRVISEAAVSLSPEAFTLSPSGDLLVAVNMERTYLPDRLPYALFGRRGESSLSLVGLNPETGALTVLDGPVGFEGVLPEAAAFDADGDMVAVAVYQGPAGEAAAAGWIALFRVDRTGPTPRLIPTGQRIPTARGLHDLLVAP